jgi:hypothetical protein
MRLTNSDRYGCFNFNTFLTAVVIIDRFKLGNIVLTFHYRSLSLFFTRRDFARGAEFLFVFSN